MPIGPMRQLARVTSKQTNLISMGSMRQDCLGLLLKQTNQMPIGSMRQLSRDTAKTNDSDAPSNNVKMSRITIGLMRQTSRVTSETN